MGHAFSRAKFVFEKYLRAVLRFSASEFYLYDHYDMEVWKGRGDGRTDGSITFPRGEHDWNELGAIMGTIPISSTMELAIYDTERIAEGKTRRKEDLEEVDGDLWECFWFQF